MFTYYTCVIIVNAMSTRVRYVDWYIFQFLMVEFVHNLFTQRDARGCTVVHPSIFAAFNVYY